MADVVKAVIAGLTVIQLIMAYVSNQRIFVFDLFFYRFCNLDCVMLINYKLYLC